jgi:hypothetical protein
LDTTGAVNFPAAFGLSNVALASLSSINGLPESNPGPPNPTYVGAGFLSPNTVTSSGSPYAYVAGDPLNGVDPEGTCNRWQNYICVLLPSNYPGGYLPSKNPWSKLQGEDACVVLGVLAIPGAKNPEIVTLTSACAIWAFKEAFPF